MTAHNICKTTRIHNSWEGFNAQCECGSDDHQHEMVIEYDEYMERVALSLYFKAWTHNPKYYDNWFKDVWSIFKFRMAVLFKGWTTVHYEFLFNGEEAVQDYINALQASLDRMKQVKADTQQKKPTTIDQ